LGAMRSDLLGFLAPALSVRQPELWPLRFGKYIPNDDPSDSGEHEANTQYVAN
jgi:hypothetical protein